MLCIKQSVNFVYDSFSEEGNDGEIIEKVWKSPSLPNQAVCTEEDLLWRSSRISKYTKLKLKNSMKIVNVNISSGETNFRTGESKSWRADMKSTDWIKSMKEIYTVLKELNAFRS